MSVKAKDERKYKYSIVSILVIGICLILMVNIGMGLKKCEIREKEGILKFF